jgi:hypothetical protein
MRSGLKSSCQTPTFLPPCRVLPRPKPAPDTAERLTALEAALPAAEATARGAADCARRHAVDAAAAARRLEEDVEGVRAELGALRDAQARAGRGAASEAAARDAAERAARAAVDEALSGLGLAGGDASARSASLEARLKALEQAAAAGAKHGPCGAAPAPNEGGEPGAAPPQGHMDAFAALLGGAALGECASMAQTCTPDAGAPLPPWQRSGASSRRSRAASGAAPDAALEARVAKLERCVAELADAAPLDCVAAGAIEARVSILEERAVEQLQAADEAQAQAAAAAAGGCSDNAGSEAPRTSLAQTRARPAAESLRAVDTFGDQLNALLTRFVPEDVAAAPATALPPAAEARLAALEAAAEAAWQAAETARADAAGAAARLGDLESGLDALRGAHAAATGAAAERATGTDAALHEVRRRLSELAEGAASEQLEGRLASLELEVASLSEAAHRASGAAVAAAAAAAAAAEAASEPAAAAAGAAKEAAVEAAAAAAGAAAAGKAAAAAGTGAAELREEVEALAKGLYELRVETQNGADDVAAQLRGLGGLKGDLEIWQAGQRAAAERAERTAAEALEQAEALAAVVAVAPAAAAEAARDAAAAAAAGQAEAAAAARAAADAASAGVEQLRERMDTLAARADDEAVDRAGGEARRAAAAADAAAVSAAVAELALQLQALSAEAAGRLDALAERVAAGGQAAAAMAPAAEAAEAAAGAAGAAAERAAEGAAAAAAGVAELCGEVGALTVRVHALEAAGAAAGAQLQQLLPLLEATDVLQPLSPAAALGAPAPGALRAPRFSLDSLDSPSFATRRGGGAAMITYGPVSAASGSGGGDSELDSPEDAAAGDGDDSSTAASGRAYDNSLFGEPPEAPCPGAAAATARSVDAAVADALLPHAGGAGGGLLSSFYSNAAFEDEDAAGAGGQQKGQQEAAAATAAAESERAVAPEAAAAAQQEGTEAVAQSSEWPLLAEVGVEEVAEEVAEEADAQGSGSSVRRRLFAASAEHDAGDGPVEEAAAAAAAMPPPLPQLQGLLLPRQQQASAAPQQPPSPQESPLLHGLASLSRINTKLHPEGGALATAPGSGRIAAYWAGLQADVQADTPGSGKAAAPDEAPASGVAAVVARFDGGGGSGLGHAAPLRPGSGGAGGAALLPPLSAAAPEAPTLKRAPHLEKGPSGFEIAKQELQRAAQASPGRVRRQAMAMESTIAALAGGSESEGSSLRPQASPRVAAPQASAEQAGGGSDCSAPQHEQQQAGEAAPTGQRARSPVSRLAGGLAASLLASDADTSASEAAVSEAGDGSDDFDLQLPGLYEGGGQAEEDADGVLRLRGGALLEEGSEADWEFGEAPCSAACCGTTGSSKAQQTQKQPEALASAMAAAPGALPSVQPGLPQQRPKRRLLGGGGASGAAEAADALIAATSAAPAAPQQPAAAGREAAAQSAGAAARPACGPGYRVVVCTSVRSGAGTDGLATLRLIRSGGGGGGRGPGSGSTDIQLQLNTQPGAFSDGSRIDFLLEECGSGGGGGGGSTRGIDGVELWHDGEGYANAWLVDKVVVQELASGGRRRGGA